MEEDDYALHNFAAEFDNIDCPNWFNFDEESYEPREADVRWFASLQPHLQTPECIIKAEQLESMQKKAPVFDISNTPNVKQRRRPKTMVNGKPPKLLSNKLQFSSSDDEEISEMLRAHNKRIQHKTAKFPISNESSTCTMEQSEPKVANERVTSKVIPYIASKTVKRRSCAPLLMKNKSSRCTSGLPSTIPDTVSESTKVNAVGMLHSSTISPRPNELKVAKNAIPSNYSCESNLSKTASSGKLSKPPPQTQPGAGILRKPALQKSSNAIVSKKRVVHKSNASSNAAKTKCTSTSKAPANKSEASQNNSTKPSKAPAASKPIIKSTVSKRPQTSNSLANKVSSASVVSKAQASIKDSLPNKKVQSKKDLGRKKQLSQMQSRSDGPFGPSNNVMSIINSKTPGKDRLKSKASELKPRYSVETPSPPRSANCELSDDEDLDAFITKQLKAHNAKVEAKMIANNRIAGKATKTGKQVSLHLGSPSRPKMKPVRHKD